MVYKGFEIRQLGDLFGYVAVYLLVSRVKKRPQNLDGQAFKPKDSVWLSYFRFCEYFRDRSSLPKDCCLSKDGLVFRFPGDLVSSIIAERGVSSLKEGTRQNFFKWDRPFVDRLALVRKPFVFKDEANVKFNVGGNKQRIKLCDDDKGLGNRSISFWWSHPELFDIRTRIRHSQMKKLRELFGDDLPLGFLGDVAVGYKSNAIWIGILPRDPVENYPRSAEDVATRFVETYPECDHIQKKLRTQAGKPSATFSSAEVHRRIRQKCFEQYRRQLCLPLRDADIIKLLPSKNLRAEEVPKQFAYVPHELTLAAVPPGQTAETAEWNTTELDDVINLIREKKDRLVLLIEAKAGYGKTTFIHKLAYELAQPETGVLPLPPERIVDSDQLQGSPVEWETLTKRATKHLPPDASETPGDGSLRKHVQTQLENGDLVAFVDGLDQQPDGPEKLLRGIPKDVPIKVVAACRQEAHATTHEGWTHVVRLGPLSTAAFEKDVPESHQDLLKACLGDDDPRHPFMLHIVRVLDSGLTEESLPEQMEGVTELFDRYLEFLFVWADARRTGQSQVEMPNPLSPAQRLAAGVLGLTSLQYLPSGEATEQAIDEEAFEIARDSAIRIARETGWSSRKVDEVDRVFDISRDDADLVYVGRKALLKRRKTFLFHHQLLQEYLAALGTIEELERLLNSKSHDARPIEALKILAEIFERVIEPRPTTDRDEVVRVGLIERIPGLRYFEFIARMFGKPTSPLPPGERLALVTSIPMVILGNTSEPIDLDPYVATALLRMRDEMIRLDAALVQWAKRKSQGGSPRGEKERNQQWVTPNKLVELESDSDDNPPESFSILNRSEEQSMLTDQLPDEEECMAIQERMRIDEPDLEWRVNREVSDYPIVVATTNRGGRWLFVPDGPFVYGGWQDTFMMPVESRTTGSFWIAHDPVTVGEFRCYIGYKEGCNKKRQCVLRDERWVVHECSGEQCGYRGGRLRGPDDLPAVLVSYSEARNYCQWLGNRTVGKGGDDLYRLATESEWEKAARGIFGRTWPWGNTWQPNLAAMDLPNGKRREVISVGENSNVSPFGVRGMAGNTWEWVKREPPEPMGMGIWSQISKRGASVNEFPAWGMCSCRFGSELEHGDLTTGFRCVRSATGVEVDQYQTATNPGA